MPEISVIIPVYNVEPYLRQCLDSVASQTFADLEVILINDGSTDNSAAICQEYIQKYPHFQLIHQKNKGLSEARNAGLKQSTGRYITFIDSDDFVETAYCHKLYQAAILHDVDLVACKYSHYTEKKGDATITPQVASAAFRNKGTGSIGDYMNRVLSPSQFLVADTFSIMHNGACAKLYCRSLFYPSNQVPLFFEPDRHYEDFILFTQLLDSIQTVLIIPDRLYYYRKGIVSITQEEPFKEKNIIDLSYAMSGRIWRLNQKELGDATAKSRSIGQKVFSKRVSAKYQGYSYDRFRSFFVAEEMAEKPFVFWGSGEVWLPQYLSWAKTLTRDITILDSSPAKQGTTFQGFPIRPPEFLLSCNLNSVHFYITNVYAHEVIHWMLEQGVISRPEQIMPYQGKTKLEQAYAQGFLQILAALQGEEIS